MSGFIFASTSLVLRTMSSIGTGTVIYVSHTLVIVSFVFKCSVYTVV
jgi:hypothetical protein